MLASRCVNTGSGIVMEKFSHSLGSARLVLSSSLSTGVRCCIILFLDLGWVGVGGGELDVLGSGCFSGGGGRYNVCAVPFLRCLA